MKQIKSAKPEDVEEFIRYLEVLKKDGVKITVGNAEQIYKNKDMFDIIITDFMK